MKSAAARTCWERRRTVPVCEPVTGGGRGFLRRNRENCLQHTRRRRRARKPRGIGPAALRSPQANSSRKFSVSPVTDLRSAKDKTSGFSQLHRARITAGEVEAIHKKLSISMPRRLLIAVPTGAFNSSFACRDH